MHINLNEEQVDKALFDALYALMQRRTIEELTVGDILEQAHVSRSSFYRHYRDKYELLTTSYKHILESTYLRCLHGSPWKESATSLYTVLADHPAFFKLKSWSRIWPTARRTASTGWPIPAASSGRASTATATFPMCPAS